MAASGRVWPQIQRSTMHIGDGIASDFAPLRNEKGDR